MDSGGWIKLHRKLTESAVFANEKLLKVWIWCLCKASYQPFQTLVGCQLVDVPGGAFIFGRKKAAEELGIKERTVYDYMRVLEKLRMISINSNNKFSLVTIENWEKYQLVDDDSNNKPTTNQQQANNKPTTNQHKQEYKEIKEDKEYRENKRENSDFDIFWNSYPRHIAKDKAKSAFYKHINGKVELDVILKALDVQKKSAQWRRDGGQFIPHPATWINQHRWEDELPAEAKSKQAASSATSRNTFTIDDYIEMTMGMYEVEGKSDEEINEKIDEIRRKYAETGLIGGWDD